MSGAAGEGGPYGARLAEGLMAKESNNVHAVAVEGGCVSVRDGERDEGFSEWCAAILELPVFPYALLDGIVPFELRSLPPGFNRDRMYRDWVRTHAAGR